MLPDRVISTNHLFASWPEQPQHAIVLVRSPECQGRNQAVLRLWHVAAAT
ncbi:hypothetical protein SBV1_3580007 [Verrucomicrobia bacterium]|nr:hypothetical protein SBV1_3580007 [Verrucomicrobiota bacterium]